MTAQWTLIHQDASTVSGPGPRSWHGLLVNRAAGKVYVMFGSLGSTFLSDMWAYSISSQQWSNIAAVGNANIAPRDSFMADFDDKNQIYILAGFTSGWGKFVIFTFELFSINN